MKVLGILGSPRLNGNSDILLGEALAGATDEGAEARKIILRDKKISGCMNCEKCNETGVCAIKDDMDAIQQQILEADTVIHSVPVYFWAMTSQMKAYLDRWCVFFDGQWHLHNVYAGKMKNKKIGLITVCGDHDVSTANPIVHSFKTLCQFAGLNWLGAVQASALAKGKISENETVKKEAYNLGKKGAKI